MKAPFNFVAAIGNAGIVGAILSSDGPTWLLALCAFAVGVHLILGLTYVLGMVE